jgi:uroporphyrinogen decarboxylase
VNSKERVQAALKREAQDRVPVFMWFHPITARHMAELLEIEPGQVSLAMGDDVRQTWVNNNYAMEGIRHTVDGESHRDDWGIEWVYQYSFNQISYHPLQQASAAEVLAYAFPYDKGEALLRLMEPVVASGNEYYIGCDVSPCVYEMYWRLRGMEETMVEMLSDPETSREMLRRCADFSVWLSEQAIARYQLDWLWTGDDVAGQEHMMMSPALWREQIKPELKRVFDVGKAHNLPVAYHCCGALRPIIPDLIEIGMDVLNPVQGTCPGMDPLELKEEFGSQISFMGGVDTQYLLPNGSVKEVRKATARLIEGMTCDGGGFILAASHTIPPETSDENIFAMYEEAGISKEEIFDRAAQIRAGSLM